MWVLSPADPVWEDVGWVVSRATTACESVELVLAFAWLHGSKLTRSIVHLRATSLAKLEQILATPDSQLFVEQTVAKAVAKRPFVRWLNKQNEKRNDKIVNFSEN